MGAAAVTFDVFGTLVDFSIQRDEAPLVANLLAEAGEDADPDRVLQTWVSQSLEERARTPFRTVRSSLRVGARRTASIHDLAIDAGGWTRALEDLWAQRPLRAGAAELLDALEAEAIPWGLVSNVDDKVLGRLLDQTGLAGRPHAIVTSERARAYKPHPRPFRMAVASLPGPRASCLHVGDDPIEDGVGARVAGVQVLVVDPDEEDLQARVREALRR